mmetsp:Transcript_29065/g.63574  ORF Transcript_29065/g.63574 Transcript_29065/m.63574 type:complete len:255 (+) Transcript_29065:208-972(+)
MGRWAQSEVCIVFASAFPSTNSEIALSPHRCASGGSTSLDPASHCCCQSARGIVGNLLSMSARISSTPCTSWKQRRWGKLHLRRFRSAWRLWPTFTTEGSLKRSRSRWSTASSAAVSGTPAIMPGRHIVCRSTTTATCRVASCSRLTGLRSPFFSGCHSASIPTKCSQPDPSWPGGGSLADGACKCALASAASATETTSITRSRSIVRYWLRSIGSFDSSTCGQRYASPLSSAGRKERPPRGEGPAASPSAAMV